MLTDIIGSEPIADTQITGEVFWNLVDDLQREKFTNDEDPFNENEVKNLFYRKMVLH